MIPLKLVHEQIADHTVVFAMDNPPVNAQNAELQEWGYWPPKIRRGDVLLHPKAQTSVQGALGV